MSICCLMIIVIVVIIGTLIIYILYLLYQKVGDKLDKKKEEGFMMPTDPENVTPMMTATAPPSPIKTLVTFTIYNQNPAIELDDCKDYMEFCNVQICKDLMNIAKIHNDKNTVQNVTYIQVPDEYLIIFITKCKLEDNDEDINYINAYASKHLSLSIYTVFYDPHTMKFIDYENQQYDTLTIDTTNKKRQLLQPSPSPPPQMPTPPRAEGNFYYIAAK